MKFFISKEKEFLQKSRICFKRNAKCAVLLVNLLRVVPNLFHASENHQHYSQLKEEFHETEVLLVPAIQKARHTNNWSSIQ